MPKKAVGTGSILPQLMKVSSDIIAERLATAINNCLIQGTFMKNTKIASVTPLDKGTPNKYEITNKYITFIFQIYENLIKNKLISNFDKVLSPMFGSL